MGKVQGKGRAPDRGAGRVASRQHGLVTLEQARRAGLSPGMVHRRVAAGRWERVHRGVYRIAGAPATWEQVVLGAVLGSPPGTVASHRTAAALHGLEGFGRGRLELTVPRGRRPRGLGAVVHQGPLAPGDVGSVGGIPVTTVARTLLDLAAVASPEALELAVDDALRRGLVTLGALRRRLEAHARRGRRGVGRLRAVLEARDPGALPGSALESLVRRVLVRAGLPAPVPQFPVRRGRRVVGRVDFAYPRERIAIEVDGFRWHSGRARWERDAARQNELVLAGWTPIRFTSGDLRERPEWVVASVRAALGRAWAPRD